MRIDGATLRADLISGVTVFTVLVPSAMAYGQLTGVTPEAGMYAGLVAMIVYAILGSSRHLIVGPEATSALLAAIIVGPIAGGWRGSGAVCVPGRAGTDEKPGAENIQADVASAVTAFHREAPKSTNDNLDRQTNSGTP
jgi:MFS superfamily sulfate permease-like transporter